jgi:hypothetical protein
MTEWTIAYPTPSPTTFSNPVQKYLTEKFN